MKIIVIKLQGYGSYSRAEFCSVHLFDNYTAASEYISQHERGGKYWVRCEIVDQGELIET